jgi:hypothetical protein
MKLMSRSNALIVLVLWLVACYSLYQKYKLPQYEWATPEKVMVVVSAFIGVLLAVQLARSFNPKNEVGWW